MRFASVFLTLAATVALARGDYPSAEPPETPPPHLQAGFGGENCPTCPWNRQDMGQYPAPFNAPKAFKPTHRGEYFDIYGHWIETRYSEVFWTAQPAVPLPKDVVAKFNNRAISFTGFEVDVVAGGENNTTEWSVPEFQVYNHHYCATIRGAGAKMAFVGHRGQDSLLKDGSRKRRHAFEVHPPEWEPRDAATAGEDDASSHIPTAQNFWQGNGGEHRKSFKHFPRGTGQLIQSPQEFILQPMLINTNNPAKPGQSPREAFHAAPLPKKSLAPVGANYSGLMECPCTTRTKRIITGFSTTAKGSCGANATLPTPEECFMAAGSLVGSITKNVTLDDSSHPAGCFLLSSSDGTEAHYNSDTSSRAQCGPAAGTPVRSIGSADSASRDLHVKIELDGKTDNATITLSGPAGVWFGVGFGATNMADLPYTITVEGTTTFPPTGKGKVSERKLGNHMPGTVLSPMIDVLSDTVGPAPEKAPSKMNHIGVPLASGDMGSPRWQECQAACAARSDCGAWTFLPIRFTTPYNLEDGTCRLRSAAESSDGFTGEGWMDGMLSGQKPLGAPKVRTVVMRRALKGASSQHFTFDPRTPSVPFIEAVGTTAQYQYHGKSRGGGSIVFVEAGAPVCVCKGTVQGGSINGIPWANNCEAYPATTIARDHNPSCSIETYGGGMICCHHGVFLLDKEQAIPAPTFRFRMKYRFYYEDPQNATAGTVASLYPGLDYQNAFFMFRETEVAHGEYDVPKCAAGTPASQCVHEVIGHFQIKDAMHECHDRADVWCSALNVPNATYPQSQHVALVHISPHCHGPACISMRMVNADTNETLCYTEPHYGHTDAAMDEAGYAAGIPPCIWGDEQDGLKRPPIVSLDTNITVIKRANSTNAHYGVMGHWQMRGIWAAAPKI